MALQEEFEKRGNWLFRHRGVLPIFILFAGIIIYLWNRVHPEDSFLGHEPYRMYYEFICLSICLFGLWIRIYTVGYTPKNTSGRNVGKQVADKLNTTGIYSLVRHPLYVGNFFMWFGLSLLTGHIWFVIVFCLSYWLYYERIMFAEEQFLRNKFGSEYLEWAETVPAFVPRLRGFTKPSLSFSWKKVIKKEKNGFAAIFLIFFLFNVAGELIVNERDFNYIIAAGFLLSLLSYVVIKILKNKPVLQDKPGR